MKRLISMMMVMVCGAMLLAGCSSKNAGGNGATMKEGQTVQTVVDQIAADVGIAMPAPIDDAILKDLFYVDPADVQAYYGQMSMVMVSADNVIAVQVKDGKIDAVKQSLEKRLEDVRATFAQYLPDQSVKAQKGQVIVKGDYAFMLILGESEETFEDDMNKAVGIIDAAF